MVKPGQIDVIKQGKRPPEEFSPDKLHNSIIATCLSVRTPEGQAQDIAKTDRKSTRLNSSHRL